MASLYVLKRGGRVWESSVMMHFGFFIYSASCTSLHLTIAMHCMHHLHYYFIMCLTMSSCTHLFVALYYTGRALWWIITDDEHVRKLNIFGDTRVASLYELERGGGVRESSVMMHFRFFTYSASCTSLHLTITCITYTITLSCYYTAWWSIIIDVFIIHLKWFLLFLN